MSFDPEGYDLDELCDEPLLESRVARLWQGTRDRIALKGEQGALRRAQAKLVLAGTLVGILVWTMWPPSAPSEPRFLALRGGGVPGALAATEERLRVELADGSTVELSAGGRWAPTYNWEGSFESELDRGRVSIDVTPGGPRRWVIRAGGTTIEVLGTRFSVERTPTRTTVSVTRGRVSVRDDRMASRQVVLGAGESVVIRTGTEESVHLPDPVVVPTDSTRRGPSPAGPPRRVVSPGARSRRARDWQELAEGGDHRGAYRELGGAGLRSQASGASPAHLMLLADVARLSGHPREAVAPLERLLREAPEDERAAIGAITLGHIYMDVMHQPARARAALERALALGAPQAISVTLQGLRAGEAGASVDLVVGGIDLAAGPEVRVDDVVFAFVISLRAGVVWALPENAAAVGVSGTLDLAVTLRARWLFADPFGVELESGVGYALIPYELAGTPGRPGWSEWWVPMRLSLSVALS